MNMKYTITEDRLVRLIDKYITSTVGEIYKAESSHIAGTESDFDLVDKNGNLVFQYLRKRLGVGKNMFDMIGGLFGISSLETEYLIERWFEKKYPDDSIEKVYYSIYY